MDIVDIQLNLIEEDIDQPRYQFDEESLQELMKSIDEIGLLSPIKVRSLNNGRYKIIYGNRRYKASKMLGRTSIPCIVSELTDEVDIYLEQIAENLTREGFSPVEEAEAFDKLLNNQRFSSSLKFLASKLSKPESYIKNKCDLLKFGPAVKKLIVSGTNIRKDRLTEEQLMPIKDLLPEHRDPLALIIARDELPVSDVKKIAQMFKDKDLSASLKDKLLYKNGPQLIETWSVYKHNKSEREKAAQEKEPAVNKPAEVAIERPPAAPVEAAASHSAAANTPIESKLMNLLASLSSQPYTITEDIHSLRDFGEDKLPKFINDVNDLIVDLEQRLADWSMVRDKCMGISRGHPE